MLALLSIPMLLGLALFIDTSSDPDEIDDDTSIPEEDVTANVAPATNPPDGSVTGENLRTGPAGGVLEGGNGDDTLTGSETVDELDGGAGDDLIYARSDNDTVTGGAGNDRTYMSDGNDISGSGTPTEDMAGDDFICGGHGEDLVADLLGSNELRGNLGRDTIIAVDGLSETGTYDIPSELGTTDTLNGGFGADLLFGDNGDIMTGGTGRDDFLTTDDEDMDLQEVRITDFNPAMDTLFVVQLDGLTSASDLSYEALEEGIRVSFEGRAVALLEGLTEDDIPGIETNIVDLAELENIT